MASPMHRELGHPPNITDAICGYYAGSGFPKAGRSLKDKIREADKFLKREIGTTIGDVGIAASIVYNDQAVLTNGYGLRQSSDKKSAVTKDSMFQIGSVSKTFIAVAIGLLVDDGKVQWTDSVKQHVPWLKLFDKYAEQHMTLGDLLSMNSGYARDVDIAQFTGYYKTERSFVEALEFFEPEAPLRQGMTYSNTNFEVLGQVVEAVAGVTWYKFLQDRLWTPLGMTNTYASVNQVPVALRNSTMSWGHIVCKDQVVGPVDLTTDAAQLVPGLEGGYIASGSIVSSAADMATFARLLLNKGSVGSVKIFKSPVAISEMLTGRSSLSGASIAKFGLHFSPDGNTLSTGYGFDYVGNLAFGHAFTMKGGATMYHTSDASFAPVDGISVVLLTNSQNVLRGPFSQLRGYLMGIFLDVPTNVLDAEYKRWQSFTPFVPFDFPGAPECGFDFWDPPHLVIKPDDAKALVGTYASTISSKFFPPAVIAYNEAKGELAYELGGYKGSLVFIAELGSTFVFKGEVFGIFVAERVPDGSGEGFVLQFGIDYRKV